jgi:hypothetical protein
MYVDDVRRIDRVFFDRIVNEAISWGLSRTRVIDIVSEMVSSIPEAVELAAAETPNVPSEIRRILETQLAMLRGSDLSET